MRAICVLGIFTVVVVAAGCTKHASPSAPSDDGRYLGSAAGSIADVKWADVETDFERAAAPGSLTFVELSGSHCGGCKKNLKLFEKLAQVRKDIAFRIVPFPEDLCPDHADPQQRAQCRALSDQIKHDGMCFTPTLWAI